MYVYDVLQIYVPNINSVKIQKCRANVVKSFPIKCDPSSSFSPLSHPKNTVFNVCKSVLYQNVCEDVCAVKVNDVLQIDVPKVNFFRTQKCSLRPYVVKCVSMENKLTSSLFPLLCPKSTSTNMLLASYVIFFVPMFLNMCCSSLCNKLFSVCFSCYRNMQRRFQNYFNTFKLFSNLPYETKETQ